MDKYKLMGWEHEIAKTLAGLGETEENLLRALLVEVRVALNELSIKRGAKVTLVHEGTVLTGRVHSIDRVNQTAVVKLDKNNLPIAPYQNVAFSNITVCD